MRCDVAHVVIYKLTPQSTQQRKPSCPAASPGIDIIYGPAPGQQVQMSSWRQISQLHDSQYLIPFGMGTECACTRWEEAKLNLVVEALLTTTGSNLVHAVCCIN